LNEVIKKLEHVRELWDKLDPRDRDVILHNADFTVDTLCDWKDNKIRLWWIMYGLC